MKKINDRNLYFYFAIVTLLLGILVGGISFYSIKIVEPEVIRLMADESNIDSSYTAAYLMLRDPQVFAQYENFDKRGVLVKKSIIFFDQKIYSKEPITGEDEDKLYLEALLKRRQMGSRLGRNTMVFLLLLSTVSWGLYFFERRASPA